MTQRTFRKRKEEVENKISNQEDFPLTDSKKLVLESKKVVVQFLVDPGKVLRTDEEGHMEGKPVSTLIQKLKQVAESD